MSEPRISVIVPAYNAADTLAECLTSLREQTLAGIEVVIVDDGSTDDTAAIARAEAERAPELVRIVSQPNAGRAAARNAGVRAARGEFLGFVDADDLAEPRMFELLLACADRTGADLVVGEYDWVDCRTDELLFHFSEGDPALYGTSVAERPDLLLQPGASVCNKLIKTTLFTEGGLSFPEGRDFEDLATAYRLTGAASRIEKVAETVYRYRQGQPGSVMSAYDERYLQILPALEVTNDYFSERGRFETLRPQLLTINFNHLISGRYDDVLRYGTRDVRHRFIKAAFAHLDEFFPGWKRDPAVRAAAGRPARYRVSTSSALLTLYTDAKAEAR